MRHKRKTFVDKYWWYDRRCNPSLRSLNAGTAKNNPIRTKMLHIWATKN